MPIGIDKDSFFSFFSFSELLLALWEHRNVTIFHPICSDRRQTGEEQRRRLPPDGEKPDSASPRQPRRPAAVPRAQRHRSPAGQSERPTLHALHQESISLEKVKYLTFFPLWYHCATVV